MVGGHGRYQDPMSSGFTFAPIIKVVNGNDNSITPVDNTIPMNPLMDTLYGGNVNQEIANSQGGQNVEESQENKPIDFTNLKIKKI